MEKRLLFDMIGSCGLRTTTTDYTRIFTNKYGVTSKSAIDYVLTDALDTVLTSSVLGPCLSDNSAIVSNLRLDTHIDMNNNVDSDYKFRMLSDSNLNEFRNMLDAQMNSDFVFNEPDLNIAFSKFIDFIRNAYNSCCPIVSKTSRLSASKSLGHIVMYADDTAMVVSGSTPEELQFILEEWMFGVRGIDSF
ncbi:hypothetical protein HHI36_001785 [Cryptolaemus montrouzieri]|uniref:Reverse transcriptase n=1 Tax=Cryptolaemus montrouzieri TaxID=559131 RepID=A0ABD2P8T6_9CUCU